MANISTFFGLETTLRALLAQQAALDTTGHNISNANTEGYTRQQAVLGASDSLQVTDGTRQSTIASLGTGVQIQAYRRIRDDFLDHLVRMLGQEPEGGYKPTGPAPRPTSHHVLNLQA